MKTFSSFGIKVDAHNKAEAADLIEEHRGHEVDKDLILYHEDMGKDTEIEFDGDGFWDKYGYHNNIRVKYKD